MKNNEKRRALITGVTGQDGSNLSDFLLEKGYEVYGLARRTANDNLQRIRHILDNDNFKLLYGDVTDISSIIKAVEKAQPDEFYNLAAQSFVGESWNQPLLTFEVTGKGCINCLEALRIVKKDTRFYQASSSEMFGKVHEAPQKETTVFHPRSPYGVAKVAAHYATINYRESYDMFCCCGILFNHEGSRRGKEFVTRKITDGVARIRLSVDNELSLPVFDLSLGNLDAKRDWGDSRDFVKAMYLMLQQDEPDDYVIATGKTRSVKDFLVAAFRAAGFSDEYKSIDEFVSQDPRFMRPAEVDLLLGDPTKAKEKLGWEPEISFERMVADMVENDLNLIRKNDCK